jgi:hypothetical protein
MFQHCKLQDDMHQALLKAVKFALMLCAVRCLLLAG